ncbi:MAG: hypothetical protein KAI71_00250 [Candidatus Pacebacteria bacterium]|nr:hypothetical protein [Candidatus Paceibacterota bacterium]
MEELVDLAHNLARIKKIVHKRRLLSEDSFMELAEEVASHLTLEVEDWLRDDSGKQICPSLVGSLVLSERGENKEIIRTGIVSIHPAFAGSQIVVADKNGCCLYKKGMLLPVTSVNGMIANNSKALIEFRVFGQKPTSHWSWMNSVIGNLNTAGIRTGNMMGHSFVVQDFFSRHIEKDGEIEIIPSRVVLSEPFSNRPTKDADIFTLFALNAGLPVEQQFCISDMSGQGGLLRNGKVKRIESCSLPHCTTSWIAGPNEEVLLRVLPLIKEAVNKAPKEWQKLPENDSSRRKIEKLIEDLSHFQSES